MTPKIVTDANRKKPHMITVHDELWDAAKKVAKRRGINMSELVRRGLSREVMWDENRDMRDGIRKRLPMIRSDG